MSVSLVRGSITQCFVLSRVFCGFSLVWLLYLCSVMTKPSKHTLKVVKNIEQAIDITDFQPLVIHGTFPLINYIYLAEYCKNVLLKIYLMCAVLQCISSCTWWNYLQLAFKFCKKQNVYRQMDLLPCSDWVDWRQTQARRNPRGSAAPRAWALM